MKNEIYLDYCIWDFEDITPEDITTMLSIQPSKVYKKGERTNPKFSKLSKQNGWRMSSGLNKYSSFEDQMNALLDIIDSKYEIFKTLSEKYHCEFSCAIYIYNNDESTPWVHLSSRYNNLIKKINVEFDLDLYCHAINFLPTESSSR